MLASPPRILRFDAFAIDTVRCVLTRDGSELPLRRQSFDVLRYLAERKGDVVSSDEFVAAVWAAMPADPNASVGQCIKEIRRALGDNGRWIIKTVSGRGYEFVAEVTPLAQSDQRNFASAQSNSCPQASSNTAGAASSAVVSDGRLPTSETATLLVQLQRLAQRFWQLAIPVLLVVVAIAFVVLWAGMRDRSAPLDAQGASPYRLLSLIVLPFQNLGGDPEQEYFADGITDGLIDGLSRQGATVIARGTAFSFKGRPIDVRELGRDLGVRYVLEGTVYRSEDQVRVTAQLADATTASIVWTETFELERRDLPKLRDDVAARLALILKLSIIHAEGARTVQDPEAADFLMRAWSLFYRAPRREVEGPRQLFLEALRRDKSLKDAWTGLAHTYLRNVRFSPTADQDLQRAAAAAERAITLDPRWSFSHLAMGWVHYEQKRMKQAHVAFHHATKLNPNEPHAQASLGAANTMLGRPEEAFAPVQRAMRLSPRDPSFATWQMFIGVAHLHLRQDIKAVDWLSKSATLSPTDPFARLFLASALALSGRVEEAKHEMGELRRLIPQFTLSRFKDREPSNEPPFLTQRERIHEGLRLAGAPE